MFVSGNESRGVLKPLSPIAQMVAAQFVEPYPRDGITLHSPLQHAFSRWLLLCVGATRVGNSQHDVGVDAASLHRVSPCLSTSFCLCEHIVAC
jgi:hypothetical protein